MTRQCGICIDAVSKELFRVEKMRYVVRQDIKECCERRVRLVDCGSLYHVMSVSSAGAWKR